VAVPGPTACSDGCSTWGAFSAQTPPTRPFSYPAPHPSPPSANVPRRDRTTGIATVCVQSLPYLTPTSVGCLPPACWPPGSPEGSWCRRGAMPGRQGRMSGTPPPRRSKPACHSPLTACPDHAPPATVGGGEGTRLRRVLLRWQAPQPCSTHRATRLTRPAGEPAAPTSFPTSIPTSFPTRWGCVPLSSLAERIGAGQSPFVGPVSRKNRG